MTLPLFRRFRDDLAAVKKRCRPQSPEYLEIEDLSARLDEACLKLTGHSVYRDAPGDSLWGKPPK